MLWRCSTSHSYLVIAAFQPWQYYAGVLLGLLSHGRRIIFIASFQLCSVEVDVQRTV